MKNYKTIFAFTLLSVLLISGALSFRIFNGPYECLICDKSIMEYGISILRIPIKYNAKSSSASEYEDWYWTNIGIKHEHHWVAVGGHYRKGLFGEVNSDYHSVGLIFFDSMPRIPDKELAISMARRVALANSSERKKLLSCLSVIVRCDCAKKFYEKKLANLSEEEAMDAEPYLYSFKPWSRRILSLEEFQKEYQIWLKYHPAWR